MKIVSERGALDILYRVQINNTLYKLNLYIITMHKLELHTFLYRREGLHVLIL